MRSLLIGLFLGYFIAACAPLHWHAAYVVALLLLGALALLRWNQPMVAGVLLGGALVGVVLLSTGSLAGGLHNQPLLADCLKKPLLLRLRVEGLPRFSADGARFNTRVQAAARQPLDCRGLDGERLRMSWRNAPAIVAGQRLLAEVKLRSFAGSVSTGAFDHELNDLRQGLLASGYVVRVLSITEPAVTDVGLLYRGEHLRAAAQRWVKHAGLDYPGLLLALLSGDTSLLERGEWLLLQDTGTVHLMIISGLHVGLVALLVYVVAGGLLRILAGTLRFVWNRGFGLAGKLAQAVLASALSALYVVFVGAGVPALRAWVMVSVLMFAQALARQIQATVLLGAAALGVIVLQPLAGFGTGFWLSFGLVGWLVLGLRQPRGAVSMQLLPAVLRRALMLHTSCALILLPLLIWFGLPFAPIAPLANLLAVPLVTLVLLPLILLAGVLKALAVTGADLVLQAADQLAGMLVSGLKGLLVATPAVTFPSLSVVHISAILVVLLALLMPLSAKVRCCAAVVLVVALRNVVSAPTELAPGHVELHVLDVGQGLAVLIRTRDGTVLYDTGASYPSGFSYADAVLAPAIRDVLQSSGEARLAALVISHGDNDHAGGAGRVMSRFRPRFVAAGAELELTTTDGARQQEDLLRTARRDLQTPGDCAWRALAEGAVLSSVTQSLLQLGEVSFHLLQDRSALTSNNRSCVLVVRAPGATLVVPGDIEAPAERGLLGPLKTAIGRPEEGNRRLVVVPHHGSRTSSTSEFIALLQPHVAVVSAGCHNRFGHPHDEVLTRYQTQGVEVLSSAQLGTITWQSRTGRHSSARAARAARWQPGAPLLALRDQNGGSCAEVR